MKSLVMNKDDSFNRKIKKYIYFFKNWEKKKKKKKYYIHSFVLVNFKREREIKES